MLYASVHDLDPPVAAGQCTKLYAEVVVGDLNYRVTSNGFKISAVRVYKDEAIEATDVYSSVMSRCEEENKISFFAGSTGSNNKTYFGLEQYEAEEKFYRTGEFAHVTDGICLETMEEYYV